MAPQAQQDIEVSNAADLAAKKKRLEALEDQLRRLENQKQDNQKKLDRENAKVDALYYNSPEASYAFASNDLERFNAIVKRLRLSPDQIPDYNARVDAQQSLVGLDSQIADIQKAIAELNAPPPPTPPESPEPNITSFFSWNNTNDAVNQPNSTPVFMPYSDSFMKTGIYKRMMQRIPVLKVVQLEPNSIGETVIQWFKKLFTNLGSSAAAVDVAGAEAAAAEAKKILSEKANTADNKTDIPITNTKFKPISTYTNDKRTELPYGIALLFQTFASAANSHYTLPIMSSPQLDIKTGSGWEKTTSIYPLITKFATGFGGTSLGSLTNNITSFLQYIGQDILLGPLFSTQNVQSSQPSFTCTTYFVNDSSAAANHNKKILRQLTMGSLPGVTEAFNFKPGALFNVAVEIGMGKDDDGKTDVLPIKKLYLCTGDFTLKAHGIYRDGVTPEIYELTSTFTSLLPDFFNMQMMDFNVPTESESKPLKDWPIPIMKTELLTFN